MYSKDGGIGRGSDIYSNWKSWLVDHPPWYTAMLSVLLHDTFLRQDVIFYLPPDDVHLLIRVYLRIEVSNMSSIYE